MADSSKKTSGNIGEEDAKDSSSSLPTDFHAVTSILKEMGVTNYEPRVVNQLLELTYKYITDVLDDSKVYAHHAGRSNVGIDDIKLAIQTKLTQSFTSTPPKELLMEVAQQKNANSLPTIKTYTGARLPPDRYCLTSINYRIKEKETKKKSSNVHRTQGMFTSSHQVCKYGSDKKIVLGKNIES